VTLPTLVGLPRPRPLPRPRRGPPGAEPGGPWLGPPAV